MRGRRTGFGMGFDYDLGSSTEGGFHYNVAARFGPALRLGSASYLCVTAGLGISGRTGEDRFGVDTPVELRVVAQVHRFLRTAIWAEWQWVAAAESREAGSPTLPFIDELRAGVSVAVVRPQFPFPGVALGAEYVEQLGRRGITAMLGFTLVVGSR